MSSPQCNLQNALALQFGSLAVKQNEQRGSTSKYLLARNIDCALGYLMQELELIPRPKAKRIAKKTRTSLPL